MATDTVLIPRLRVTVNKKAVDRVIVESIGDLGYEKPRQYQINVLFKFVSGRDTFISMPTGSGKSVCFASTPIVFDKLKGYYTDHSPSPGLCTHHCITVVVSPLTALMQDQVSKFQSKGLKAACVGGEEKGFDGVINGDVQLVYLSPESVLSKTHWREMFKTPCYSDNLVCLAIDEAHLAEKW